MASLTGWRALAEPVDYDRDGDVDLLVIGRHADEYHWFENTAGDGSLWTGWLIDSGMSNMYSFEAVDLDGDGDLDAVGGALTDSSSTMWWQNLSVHRSAIYLSDRGGDRPGPRTTTIDHRRRLRR